MIVDDYKAIAAALADRECADKPSEVARRFSLVAVDLDRPLTEQDISSIADWLHLAVSDTLRLVECKRSYRPA
jgi:hypothetical protein